MPQDIGGLLPCPTDTFSITNKPGRNNKDADALSRIKWPEAVDISSQSVHAVCEGVQAPHGKIETLCHGDQAVGVLSQDNMTTWYDSTGVESGTSQRFCNMSNSRGNADIKLQGKLKLKRTCL